MRYYSVIDEKFLTKEEVAEIEKENNRLLESKDPADWFKCKFILGIADDKEGTKE